MATFANYQDILPDPSNPISAGGGSDASGASGPGYRAVSLTSSAPIIRDVANSGRVVTRAVVYHKWQVKLSYNPLTQAEFDAVNAFLMGKQASLKPFFISLPQYTHSGAADPLVISEGSSAGQSTLLCNSTANGTIPKPGMLGVCNTVADSTHTKAYMITRVETPADHVSTSSVSTGYRITISPPLQKPISSGDTFNYGSPLLQVQESNSTRSFNLNSDGLYSLSLTLEEVQR